MTGADPGDAEIVAAMAAGPAELWARLFAAAEALRKDPAPAVWRPSRMQDDGTVVLGYPAYSDATDAVQQLLYDLHVIVSFDWPAWDGSSRYPRGNGLASAPAADAARLATAIMRGERFCDGTISQAIADGTLDAVLRRLRRWFEDERTAGSRQPGSDPSGRLGGERSDRAGGDACR